MAQAPVSDRKGGEGEEAGGGVEEEVDEEKEEEGESSGSRSNEEGLSGLAHMGLVRFEKEIDFCGAAAAAQTADLECDTRGEAKRSRDGDTERDTSRTGGAL